MAKPGDLVEIRTPSRHSVTGETWIPAIIESIQEPYHNGPWFIRVKTVSGDARADAMTYQRFQVRKPNILVAIAVAAADPPKGENPYTVPAEYANTLCPALPSRGLADGPLTTERIDPNTLLKTIVELDRLRLNEPEKVPSHQAPGRGRKLLGGIRWAFGTAIAFLGRALRILTRH